MRIDESLVKYYLHLLKGDASQVRSYNNKRYYARKSRDLGKSIAAAVAWECFKCEVGFEGN